jgi:hypothetical protein
MDGRILGRNKMVTAGTRVLVLYRNNVGPTADMSRRVVTINLDPGSTRRTPGLGLMALTIMFTPAHTFMLQQPELFGMPIWALWLRLLIQVGLLGLLWWSMGAPQMR